MSQNRRIIGLTGGIGTGKSTVSQYLANQYHLPIFDADILARKAVNPDSPILTRIVKRYGNQICLDNGQLNRQKLGEIIFNNPTEKQWLESQIHPFVREKLEQAITQSLSDTLVFVIPLLFEAKMTDLVTEIWVVSCPVERQIERIMRRNSLTKDDAIARIKSQLPLSEKLAQADVVIDNSDTLDTLWPQIDRQFS